MMKTWEERLAMTDDLAKLANLVQRLPIYGDINDERERQAVLGYTRDHDLKHGGTIHLLGQIEKQVRQEINLIQDLQSQVIGPVAYDPLFRRRFVQIAAMVVAAVELLSME